MTCDEFKEQVAAYALGSLEPDEWAACEAHLAQAKPHDGCAEALARANLAKDALAHSLPPVRPRPEVWGRIEARLSQEAAPVARAGARGTRAVPWLVAAAAVAALFVVYVDRARVVDRLAVVEKTVSDAHVAALAEIGHEQELRRGCQRDLAAARDAAAQRDGAVALLAQPATRVVALAPQEGARARATAIVNLDGKTAYLVGGGLTPQGGKDYEMWVIRGDKKLPAGLVHSDASGGAVVALAKDALSGGVDAIAVTLEPAGGGAQPQGPILLVGTVPKG
jgi:anti-sigma-K factor RskA